MSSAQEVEIVKIFKELESSSTSADFRILPIETKFMSDSKLARLSSYCRNDKESNLRDLYSRFRSEAFNMGANCFVVDAVDHHANNRMTVIISIYKLTDGVIREKQADFGSNLVYLLGDLLTMEGDWRKLKVNRNEIRIKPLQVLIYTVGSGEKFKINVGGFFGRSYRFVGVENMSSKYLSFGGFSAAPAIGYGMGIGGGLTPGIRFYTGKINHINFDLGQFYVQVMQTGDDYAK